MAVLWFFERPEHASEGLSKYLLGEFAVRCFASVNRFCQLARFSTVKPQLVVVNRQDFEHHDSMKIKHELAKMMVYPLLIELFPSELTQVEDPQCFLGQKTARAFYSKRQEILFLVKQLQLSSDRAGYEQHLRLNQDYIFDPHAHRISAQDVDMQIDLSPKEGRILRLLMTKAHTCVERREIEADVWSGCRVSKRTVDSHISRLRKKLEPIGFQICSRYGKGYRLEKLQ